MTFPRIILIEGLLLALLSGAALGTGAGNVSFSALPDLLTGTLQEPAHSILMDVRLPRILTSILAGLLLGAAGCATQTIFRNPLASPHVLGTVNAAALGAVLGLLLGTAGGIALTVPMSLLFGIGSMLILLIPQRFLRSFSATLILAGIAVNAFTSAMTSGILFLADERLQGIVFWLLGGFWRADFASAGFLAAASLCIVPLFCMHRELDVLSLGESAARAAGVNTSLIQAAAAVLAAAMAAFCVSFCGVIGFVGLLVPHFARLCGMVHFREQLIVSALSGGILLLAADTIARTLSPPLEIPVGIFTSLLGAPFFLYVLFRKTREL